MTALYHDAKTLADLKALAARRRTAQRKSNAALVGAFIAHSWHNTFRWPTYRRTL